MLLYLNLWTHWRTCFMRPTTLKVCCVKITFWWKNLGISSRSKSIGSQQLAFWVMCYILVTSTMIFNIFIWVFYIVSSKAKSYFYLYSPKSSLKHYTLCTVVLTARSVFSLDSSAIWGSQFSSDKIELRNRIT